MERFLEDLVRAQRASGIDAFALVHGAPGAQAAPADDPFWLRRAPVWREVAFVPVALSFRAALARAITDFQPDYLHLHLPNVSPLWAFLLADARRLPWVIHWHSDVVASAHSRALRLLYPLFRPFEAALLERASLIVATSRPYLDSSVTLRPYREKCRVVPLGLDASRLVAALPVASASACAPTEGWLSGAGKLRVLAVGRLTYYKAFDTLIRACAAAPATELSIVGDGMERAALERLIIALGAQERVRLLGGVSDAVCAALYRECDVLCLPSRERTEAFGMVLLEAMALAKPVFASRLAGSGMTAVVLDGVTGRLLPVDDVDAWRDALSAAATDRPALRAMGAAGRQRFVARYDIAAVSRALARAVAPTPALRAASSSTAPALLVVIPAHNEAATIAAVVRDLRDRGYPDIVVVDDGSSDATGAIAAHEGAVVLRAPLHMGAWGALQLGFRYALNAGARAVLTMDADGQHPVAEVAKLVSEKSDSDVVIGACTSRGGVSRQIAWAMFRRLTGLSLDDLTSGFRLYRGRKVVALLASEAATMLDYQDVGVLMLLRRSGMSITEVEVRMQPRTHGKSRIFGSIWTVSRYVCETALLAIVGVRASAMPRRMH